MAKQPFIDVIRKLIVVVFQATLMVCSATAWSQSNNKRCYTVDETFYTFQHHETTATTKPIKHCYSDKDHPYRYSVVDIPVSLGEGTVRTPEFSPSTHWYWILIQIEKPLPTAQLSCMMSTSDGLNQCSPEDRLLQADWTVLEGGRAVRSGSNTTRGDGMYTSDNIFKFLGSFSAVSGKRYSLEIKFTKDGSRLNAANPHLIVVKQGEE